MSRSYRKPYISIACTGKKCMKKWKEQCNTTIRRKDVEFEMGSPGFTKRITNRWTAPDDGKQYADEEKFRRK